LLLVLVAAVLLVLLIAAVLLRPTRAGGKLASELRQRRHLRRGGPVKGGTAPEGKLRREDRAWRRGHRRRRHLEAGARGEAGVAGVGKAGVRHGLAGGVGRRRRGRGCLRNLSRTRSIMLSNVAAQHQRRKGNRQAMRQRSEARGGVAQLVPFCARLEPRAYLPPQTKA
jgi:hypothetical protein